MNKINLTTAQQNALRVCGYYNKFSWFGLKKTFNQQERTNFSEEQVKAEYKRLHAISMDAGKVAMSW